MLSISYPSTTLRTLSGPGKRSSGTTFPSDERIHSRTCHVNQMRIRQSGKDQSQTTHVLLDLWHFAPPSFIPPHLVFRRHHGERALFPRCPSPRQLIVRIRRHSNTSQQPRILEVSPLAHRSYQTLDRLNLRSRESHARRVVCWTCEL